MYCILDVYTNVKTEELWYWGQCRHLEAVLEQGVEGGAELVQEDAAARGGGVGGAALVLVQQQALHRRVQGHEQPCHSGIELGCLWFGRIKNAKTYV